MRGCSALRKPFTRDTSTARRQSAVSVPFPLGSNPSPSLSTLRSKAGELDSLVFSTCSGQPLCRRNLLHRHLQPVCEELGLPRITWHCLRHCHATLLNAVGAPLGTIQALLGHASSEITRGRSICTRSLRSNAEREKEWRNFLLDPNGPKLLESCKGQISNRLICRQIDGGRDRVRTCDPLLAK